MQLDTYSQATGGSFTWNPGYSLKVAALGGEVVIAANAEGLKSLARHLLTMAQADVPDGYHIHFEPELELEDQSLALVLEKVD